MNKEADIFWNNLQNCDWNAASKCMFKHTACMNGLMGGGGGGHGK